MKPAPWMDTMNHLLDEWHRLIESTVLSPLGEQRWMSSDYYETEQDCVYVLEIPRLSPKHELDVRVKGNSLVVNGHTYESDQSDHSHYQREMAFSYTFPIQRRIKPEKLTTQLDGDVLTIRLPKR